MLTKCSGEAAHGGKMTSSMFFPSSPSPHINYSKMHENIKGFGELPEPLQKPEPLRNRTGKSIKGWDLWTSLKIVL